MNSNTCKDCKHWDQEAYAESEDCLSKDEYDICRGEASNHVMDWKGKRNPQGNQFQPNATFGCVGFQAGCAYCRYGSIVDALDSKEGLCAEWLERLK